MHGKKDKICSFDLAEQMKAGISDSHLIPFENSGHSLFLEETKKVNAELIKSRERELIIFFLLITNRNKKIENHSCFCINVRWKNNKMGRSACEILVISTGSGLFYKDME